MLNEDYKDLLLALSEEKVKYLLVGAYALAAHGYPRATMDNSLDVQIDDITLRVPSVTDLLRNKRASGRTRDLADAEALEELENLGSDR